MCEVGAVCLLCAQHVVHGEIRTAGAGLKSRPGPDPVCMAPRRLAAPESPSPRGCSKLPSVGEASARWPWSSATTPLQLSFTCVSIRGLLSNLVWAELGRESSLRWVVSAGGPEAGCATRAGLLCPAAPRGAPGLQRLLKSSGCARWGARHFCGLVLAVASTICDWPVTQFPQASVEGTQTPHVVVCRVEGARCGGRPRDTQLTLCH